MSPTLVIGVGNSMRGDDAAGPMVAAALTGCAGIRAVAHEGDGAALLDLWAGYESVVIVDAMVSGAPAGTIRSFEDQRSLPRGWFAAGSHLISVPEALGLAEVLGRLPDAVLVVGIEGKAFEMGAPASPEVEDAVRRVARQIAERFGP